MINVTPQQKIYILPLIRKGFTVKTLYIEDTDEEKASEERYFEITERVGCLQ